MSVPSSVRAVQDDPVVESRPLDEVLYRTERTLIVRRHEPGGGHIVVKQAIGVEAIARLRHEVAMLARLRDVEGVVRLAPVSLPEHSLALVDEQGVSLSQVLMDAPLSLDAIITLAWQLARTLTQVHRHGIVHKDINPANILLVGPQRQPVLIDFNIASGHVEERPDFTQHSHIAGTMAYMAPEQTGRTGRPVDSRADLYALGVTLYELTLGRKPFENEDLLELIHDHLVRTPTAPQALRADLPVAWSDLIMRLLEKEPDRRYQTAEGLANDLLRLRDSLARGDFIPFELGQDDFPLRLSAPARQIGRDAELEQLRQALASAISGRGRALVVAGAPGVGKSALIRELQPMVTAHLGMFVSGKFDQYHHDGSSAIVQALRALGRQLLAEPEAEVAILRERALHNLGANAGLGPSLLPEFSVLLGQVQRVSVADPVEAETRMIQSSIDLLRSVVSPERPLVMVVEDLQWAPVVSLRFMDAMLMAGDALNGLLLVGAFRDSEVDATHPLRAMLSRWQQLGVAPAVLSLSNLPEADTNALIGEMLKLAPPEAERLGTTLRERTGGNPYDTVELINALRQDGLLVPVLSHGQLRAVLVLENRQRRGAFSADRLETVSLIAGQLSVSLDNALLYDSLERKVAERTAALEAANQRLEVLSVTDALTGVANRRRFAEALDAEWLRARRTGTPIGLAMIDIDQFKLYNDHYGHQGGDACLTMVAGAMKRGLRAGSDLIARYGGEEFVLLLPNTDLPGALTVAERVRKAVAALAAPHALSGHGIVTVSIGIVSFVPDDSNSASQFIEVADTALYAAKRGGRNQVKSGLN